MKNIIFLILINVSIALASCVSKTPLNKDELEILNSLLDRYFSVYYDYPPSKESFISFCERDVWQQEQLYDHSESILNQFKNRNEIIWLLDDGRFPNQELTILFDKDTLINRHNNWRYPCLGFYNDAYVEGYLSEPSSLQDLLFFCNYCDSLTDFEDWPYSRCDSITMLNLHKSLYVNGLKWVQDEKSLFIIIDEDTIWRHYTITPCMRNEQTEMFEPHFYNSKGYYVKTSEDINCNFKHGIRNLAIRMSNHPNEELVQFHILVYSANTGLTSYCEDDSINFETNWYRELELFLDTFVAENNLNKIIFSAPTIE